MNPISQTVADIANLHKEVGTAELARLTGLPYMTIKDAAARNFRHRSVEVLETLADAAAKKRARQST